MHVVLSAEQELLAATAGRVAEAPQPWLALAAADLLALAAPADAGGGGATGVEVALVAEQLGARVAAAPYVAQGVLAPALLAAADADVAAVAGGEERVAVLLTADLVGLCGPDAEGLALGVEGAADVLTVDGDGWVRRHPVTGAARPSVDPSQLVLPLRPGDGEVVGRRALTDGDRHGVEALALAALAADALGVAGRALALAVEHAGTREQFGRPIGSFQAVQHMLADAAVVVEGMRSSAWHGAWAASALDPPSALLAARQAKAWCGRGARRVVEIAVQCLGGIAVTWEHPAHRLLRRALLDDALLGPSGTQLDHIAAARLTPSAGAGLTSPDPAAHPTPSGRLISSDPAAHPTPSGELAIGSDGSPSDPIASSGGEGAGGGGGLDYAESAAEADLRRRVRAWLGGRTEPWGDGDDPEVRHRWHAELARGGWVGMSIPAEDGGRGGTVVDEAIVNEELARAGAPPAPAIGHLAHAIRLFGRPDQRSALLPPLLAGTERWCQGFSEPGAGSDLAAIATRAVRGDDGRYRISGQKVWTSDAVWADRCLLLARSGADQPAHRGLSMLVVPMAAPGIDVRPITTAHGSEEFAEVFLDEVEVPADAVLGAPGQGWEIAMALLGFERGPSDIGWTARLGRRLSDLEAAVREGRRVATAPQRRALAEAWCDLEALRLHVLRTTHARRDGRAPGPEGSIDKLLMIEADQRLGHVVLDLLGADAVLDEAVAMPGYVWSRAQSIFGGTQQVQRTIVATRVLGLPRAP